MISVNMIKFFPMVCGHGSHEGKVALFIPLTLAWWNIKQKKCHSASCALYFHRDIASMSCIVPLDAAESLATHL